MLKLKNGVTGFIYDSQYGCVDKIFNEPLTAEQEKLISSVINDYAVLFTSDKDVNDMFEFEEDENGTVEFSVEDGLGEVIEWVS
jgi:hypothetical protein